jgi:hypothetical protein
MGEAISASVDHRLESDSIAAYTFKDADETAHPLVLNRADMAVTSASLA